MNRLLHRRTSVLILLLFCSLAFLSFRSLSNLKVTYDIEQFFPEEDEDLLFYRAFIKEFKADDDFLLVAIRRAEGVFEAAFLKEVHQFSQSAKTLPFVLEAQSLSFLSNHYKTPFGLTSAPLVHLDQPDRIPIDGQRILADERFAGRFVSKDGQTLLVYLKVEPAISYEQSEALMQALHQLTATYSFEQVHYLGRSYLQTEIVRIQGEELFYSTLIAAGLVLLILLFLFRKFAVLLIALLSVGMGLLLFFGFMSWTERALNTTTALYPLLMIIVGTSDVIHILSKYRDELGKGSHSKEAIHTTLKESGVAILLTSLTTAIGFATLYSSDILPIRAFGINAAIGVMIAYATVLFFTTACLILVDKKYIQAPRKENDFWLPLMSKLCVFTKNNTRSILVSTVVILLISAFGLSQISTNHIFVSGMPKGEKVTEDFQYFEQHLFGFQPMEYFVFAAEGLEADDYLVLREIDAFERRLSEFSAVSNIYSPTATYKNIHLLFHQNRPEEYVFPKEEKRFKKYKRFAKRIPSTSTDAMISEDRTKARISSRIQDIGADEVKAIGLIMDDWIKENIDPQIATIKRTGTGLMLDKSSEYIRESLIWGLGLAILMVSVLMMLLFRNVKLLVVCLLPNMIPLLLAGALLGYSGTEMEMGIPIVFAVIFGIVVDDTIHFLGKFKLLTAKGLSTEEALQLTFRETGKALCLTTIILFFGFMVLLFSKHPPTFTAGWLVSLTLLSALFCDLLLIPPLLRWLVSDELPEAHQRFDNAIEHA